MRAAHLTLLMPVDNSPDMQQVQINQLRSAVIPAQQLFLGGRPTDALGDARLDVLSPIDGRCLTTIADGDAADIDRAVKLRPARRSRKAAGRARRRRFARKCAAPSPN